MRPDVFGGQAAVELLPGLAVVAGVVDAAIGAAGDQRPDVPRGVGQADGVDDVGVAGVKATSEMPVRSLMVTTVFQVLLLSVVCRARGHRRRPTPAPGRRPSDPRRSRAGRRRMRAGCARRRGEADVGPRSPRRLRSCRRGRRTTLRAVVLFSTAHPDDVRIVGVERDAADRIRGLTVEDRFPGGAGVGGLPDAAGRGGDEPGRGSFGSTTRSEIRPDATAGPIERNFRPEEGSELHFVSGFFGSFEASSFLSVAAWAAAARPMKASSETRFRSERTGRMSGLLLG